MWSWSPLEWLQCLTSLAILATLLAVMLWDRKVSKREERERGEHSSKAQPGAQHEFILPFDDESEDHNAA